MTLEEKTKVILSDGKLMNPVELVHELNKEFDNIGMHHVFKMIAKNVITHAPRGMVRLND